jgi:hypothetical protein
MIAAFWVRADAHEFEKLNVFTMDVLARKPVRSNLD